MSPGDTELEQNNSIKLLPLREMIINDKLETVKGNNETRFCRNNKMQQSSKNSKKKSNTKHHAPKLSRNNRTRRSPHYT